MIRILQNSASAKKSFRLSVVELWCQVFCTV